jgi:sec-independent protein translocase protein TatB
MFDIGWSELLIFVVVALLVIDKDQLPTFLRSIGRYAGVVRRQADEFRSYFDAAIREAELEGVQKEIDAMRDDVESGLKDATSAAAEVHGKDAAAKPDEPRLSIDEGSHHPAATGTTKSNPERSDD